ncbi:MAG TPA: hypothetical protein DCW41_07425 [Clostridiales bacterium]|jgi:hypothetical protein|nr:hypothetical protein [Clostridiales bacterium]
MYVHIGDDIAVRSDTVTAVVNLETVLPSQKDVTGFIKAEDENNRLQYLTDDIPRSMILTVDRTYISSLSVEVLRRRIEGEMTI